MKALLLLLFLAHTAGAQAPAPDGIFVTNAERVRLISEFTDLERQLDLAIKQRDYFMAKSGCV